jgi:hypothetical protein
MDTGILSLRLLFRRHLATPQAFHNKAQRRAAHPGSLFRLLMVVTPKGFHNLRYRTPAGYNATFCP